MKELSISSLNRIANQFETVFNFLTVVPPEKIMQMTPAGKWSVHHNLAHLGRYQEIFIDRVNAILKGDNPAFEKYISDEDPQFDKWKNYSTAEILDHFKDTRRKIFNLFIELKPEQVEKKGRHPGFGEMNLIWWTEFFLLHESHHLLTIYALLCEKKIYTERV